MSRVIKFDGEFVTIFISKYVYFKKARVTNFADIIKILTMFIETIFKVSKKVEGIRDFMNAIYICIS